EEALRGAHAACAVAGRAFGGLGAFFAARAMAGIALRAGGDLDGRLLAFECFFERYGHIVAQVGAARGGLAAAAALPAAASAEQVFEDVSEARAEIEARIAAAESAKALRAGAAAAGEGVMAVAVIGGFFLLVLQHVGGVADLLEGLFGLFVA